MSTTDNTPVATGPLGTIGTIEQQAAIAAQIVQPLLPPRAQIVLAASIAGLQLLQQVLSQNQDVTDEQLQGYFDQFAVQAADDAQAQADAKAKGDTTGT